MRLSLVMVTKGEPRAVPFIDEFRQLASALGAQLVIGAHGPMTPEAVQAAGQALIVPVHGGYLEELLPQALKRCVGQFVFRLDDDERCSSPLFDWLRDGHYIVYDNWHFSRAHLWPDEHHFISSEPFWPDYQTRLSIRQKANRPAKLHVGSPYPGRLAPAAIEHHNFLVKSPEERVAIAENYARIAGRVLDNPDAARANPSGEISPW